MFFYMKIIPTSSTYRRSHIPSIVHVVTLDLVLQHMRVQILQKEERYDQHRYGERPNEDLYISISLPLLHCLEGFRKPQRIFEFLAASTQLMQSVSHLN